MIIGQIKSVVIATPCGDMEKSRKGHHMAGLIMQCMAAGLRVGYGPARGTYVEMNQNALVAGVLDQKADALLLVDSDQTFPPMSLIRLIARNKPIVGCTYRRREEPHHLMGKHLDGLNASSADKGCVEMDYVPSGMMLIRASVLRALPYPWFFNTYGEKISDFVGNDVNFCRKARAAGHSVWCDFDLSREVGHIGDRVLGWEL